MSSQRIIQWKTIRIECGFKLLYVAEIWSAFLILFDFLKNTVCIPCPINKFWRWGIIAPVDPSSYSLNPWPFSDPHSIPWLFTYHLDCPIHTWGSILTDNINWRAGGLEGRVSKWKRYIFSRLTGWTEDRRAGRRAAEKDGPACRKGQPSGPPFSASMLNVQPAGPP